jgi:hypothetical protein
LRPRRSIIADTGNSRKRSASNEKDQAADGRPALFGQREDSAEFHEAAECHCFERDACGRDAQNDREDQRCEQTVRSEQAQQHAAGTGRWLGERGPNFRCEALGFCQRFRRLGRRTRLRGAHDDRAECVEHFLAIGTGQARHDRPVLRGDDVCVEGFLQRCGHDAFDDAAGTLAAANCPGLQEALGHARRGVEGAQRPPARILDGAGDQRGLLVFRHAEMPQPTAKRHEKLL